MAEQYLVFCSCGTRISLRVDRGAILDLRCERCERPLSAQKVSGNITEFRKEASEKTVFLGDTKAGQEDSFLEKAFTLETAAKTVLHGEAEVQTLLGEEEAEMKTLTGPENIASDQSGASGNLQHVISTTLPQKPGPKASPDTLRRVAPEIKKIGEYDIVDLLGQGGMGRVYSGRHEKSGEKVAIKVLLSALEGKTGGYFQREAQMLMQLDHPNIVKLRGQGTHDQHPYLVMEFVDGKSLKTLADKKPLQPRHAAQMIYSLLDALDYAAQFKFIHRDIKPENILLDSQTRTIKLVDLGLGKIIGESFALSKTGNLLGTPFYMAPEQFSDAKHVDQRADLYSVGATLYYLLCGVPPFARFGSNYSALFYAKMKNNVVPLAQMASDLPREIARVVEKAMETSREKRYQSAKEMKEEVAVFWNLAKTCEK